MTTLNSDPTAPSDRRPFVLGTTLLLAFLVATTSPVTSAQGAPPSPDSSTEPLATALPEGFSPRMARQVASVVEAVPGIRDLAPADEVTYRIIDQEAFLAELEQLFEDEYSADQIAAEDEAFTRLGLLDAEDDLRQLILDLYDSQVLAYYDPRTKTFSLVGKPERIGDLESVVIAHEYDHALQDAAWDLEAGRIKDLDRSDAILAQQALIEGDATATMYDWAARELSILDLLAVSGEAMTRQDERLLRRIPPILRRQLEFPYIDGFNFVNVLRGRGDWQAVDEAWNAQPASTEQILHPELYPDEAPVEVALPDIAALLGSGWTRRYEQTLGEMQTGVWVADGRQARALFPGLPAQLPRAAAAAGWGGDRLVSEDGPDGSWAVAWQTEWDTLADADEFRDAARDAVKDLAGAHAVSADDVSGGLSFPVLVLVADDDETLATVQTALGR
jgi:hypothetical protein